jgi:hypothetical protein
MKTGIEAFAEERQKQIEKHGFTGEHHAKNPAWYDKNQLVDAAKYLSNQKISPIAYCPKNWDAAWFERLCRKPFKERLKISGALMAAEWDRQKSLGNFK